MKHAIAAALMMWVIGVQAQGPTREEACAEYVTAYRGLHITMRAMGSPGSPNYDALLPIFGDYYTRRNNAKQPVINSLSADELEVMRGLDVMHGAGLGIIQSRDWGQSLADHALVRAVGAALDADEAVLAHFCGLETLE